MFNRNNNYKSDVTDNIIRDRFTDFDYTPLSRKEEISLIKKLKLSYYHEADESEKELYLNYYFEEFPEFKKQYENSNEKEKLLNEAIENASKYRTFFIENNTRLVFAITKNIFGVNDKFEDLFQEGIIGLMRALEKFDISEENRFSTYATWWIRQSVIRYHYNHNDKRKISISVHLCEKIYTYKKIKEALEIKLGRVPSNEEIAQIMGISPKKLEKILFINYNSYAISLDEPVTEDENHTRGDLVPDGTDFANDIDNKLSYQVLIDALNNLDLDNREKKIINMRFGLNGENIYTYREISEKFNITITRVKQLEKRILNRLHFNQDIVELYDSKNQRVSDYKVKTLK